MANKVINGHQCTLLWYVENNKVPHKDPKVVDKVLEMLKDYFGNLTITRGKAQQFLWIDFKIRDDKRIELSAEDQILAAIKMVEDLGEEKNASVSTPANGRLCTVDDEDEPLDEKKAEIFHSCTAKNLYITKRVRPDVETTVSFLCTRVSKSTIKDWHQLKRMLGFLKKPLMT